MRKELRKQLVLGFVDELSRRLPEFKKDREAKVPPGWSVYCKKGTSNLTFYIVLVVHSMKDSFTVEGAWSTTGVFPNTLHSLRPSDFPQLGNGGAERDHEFRFRATHLWEIKEYWWDFTPRKSFSEQFEEEACDMDESPLSDAFGRVSDYVSNAVGKIVEHLIPYFDDVCRAVKRGES